MQQKELSKRWLILVAGVATMLFAGILYAWSILKVPFAEEEQVKALVREAMMGAARMAVPLEIEIQAGKSWYETK